MRNPAFLKISCSFLSLILLACGGGKQNETEKETRAAWFVNPLMPSGARPWALFHEGEYYYMQDADDRIVIWRTKDLTDLQNAEQKVVWLPDEQRYSSHIWAPEMYRIDGKWYIYFAADDGNTDNHRIYVIENEAEDPFDGEFVMKGAIRTDKEDHWAIHPSVFEHRGERYMIWSGWPTRRIESETQCIYIARMENPWTLATERVMLSEPKYEWERQWINPDGSKTGYPIYVNEDPQFFYSKEKDRVLIFYSASGTWTPYYAVGLLTADAGSDLLDPASWTKNEDPLFIQNPEDQVFAPGCPCFIPSPDESEIWFLYHARAIDKEPYGSLPAGPMDTRSPRLQKMEWDANGLPDLGIPLSEIEKIIKPSGTN